MTDAGADPSAPGRDPVRVRVRGIYATAVTRLLRQQDGLAVVQASAPIRDRFDAPLPTEPADAAVETTSDRQGVGVHGDVAAVAAVESVLSSVGVDALRWRDTLARGAVFDGRVTETLGGGAVVDCGDDASASAGGSRSGSGSASRSGSGRRAEGYLPYDAAEDYLEEGDGVRVQVREPAPPWADHRAELDTAIEADDGLARLVRGAPESGASSVDLAQVLPDDPRDGWAVRWDDRADDADLDALADALADLNDRAAALDAVLADSAHDAGGESGRLVGDGAAEPANRRATTWVWFGRESRFALDDVRQEVVPTMPGHHRIKAGARAASTAVDFAEAVCAPGTDATTDTDANADANADTKPDANADTKPDANADDDREFPFGVVARQFGPREGDRLAIEHGKPSGRLLTLGRGEVTALDVDGWTATVERRMSGGGTYDALGVERRAGDVAVTKLKEGRWWYPTVYRSSDGERRGTYVNVCTPVELFPDAARYVDLHVDVVKHADGTVERVDDDELDAAVDDGDVPGPLAEKARAVATAVERALRD